MCLLPRGSSFVVDSVPLVSVLFPYILCSGPILHVQVSSSNTIGIIHDSAFPISTGISACVAASSPRAISIAGQHPRSHILKKGRQSVMGLQMTEICPPNFSSRVFLNRQGASVIGQDMSPSTLSIHLHNIGSVLPMELFRTWTPQRVPTSQSDASSSAGGSYNGVIWISEANRTSHHSLARVIPAPPSH